MLSVIMPSYNQADFISDAIESVLSQSSPIDVELVISDGGSTDHTVDVLKAKSKIFDNLNWVSEKDSGPANALNKALEKTRGTLIGWLNSDDLYAHDAFSLVHTYFDQNPDKIMVYGQGEHVDVNGQRIELYPTQRPEVGMDAFRNGSFICQPTVFFKRALYTLLGPLDESYKAAFDFEYWLRTFKNFEGRIGFVDSVLAKSRLHDDCITQKMRGLVASDGARVVSQYFGHAPVHWLSTYIEEIQSDLDENQFLSETENILAFLKTLREYFDPKEFNALIATI